MLALPILSRSAIHFKLIVVSVLGRRAMRIFPPSPLRRRLSILHSRPAPKRVSPAKRVSPDNL
jgi:hypothetical protein